MKARSEYTSFRKGNMVAINQSGIVRTMVESQFVIAEPCAVTLARVRQVVVVNHRWVSPHNPDVDTHETGEQLEAIRAFFTKHTEILYVWFDFGCLQQREKDSSKGITRGLCQHEMVFTAFTSNVLRQRRPAAAQNGRVPLAERGASRTMPKSMRKREGGVGCVGTESCSLPSLRLCCGREGLLRHKIAGSHWLNVGIVSTDFFHCRHIM